MSFKLLSSNINSLNSHIEEFLNLVAEIQSHIITLTETWLKDNYDNSVFNLKDFIIFRRDRNSPRHWTTHERGGGVACLIHNSLKAKVLYVSISNHLNQPEYLILDIISPSGVRLLLSVIYRRSKGNLLNEFFDIFNKYAIQSKNFIITDLNCDLISFSYVSNHLKTLISEQSRHCVPYGATHHVDNSESWLDVILMDNKCKQGAFFQSNQPFINGHDYLVCEYLLDLPKRCEKQVKFRSFSDKNRNDLATSLMRSLNTGVDSLDNDDPN